MTSDTLYQKFITMCITGPKRDVEAEAVLVENRRACSDNVKVTIEKEWGHDGLRTDHDGR